MRGFRLYLRKTWFSIVENRLFCKSFYANNGILSDMGRFSSKNTIQALGSAFGMNQQETKNMLKKADVSASKFAKMSEKMKEKTVEKLIDQEKTNIQGYRAKGATNLRKQSMGALSEAFSGTEKQKESRPLAKGWKGMFGIKEKKETNPKKSLVGFVDEIHGKKQSPESQISPTISGSALAKQPKKAAPQNETKLAMDRSPESMQSNPSAVQGFEFNKGSGTSNEPPDLQI